MPASASSAAKYFAQAFAIQPRAFLQQQPPHRRGCEIQRGVRHGRHGNRPRKPRRPTNEQRRAAQPQPPMHIRRHGLRFAKNFCPSQKPQQQYPRAQQPRAGGPQHRPVAHQIADGRIVCAPHDGGQHKAGGNEKILAAVTHAANWQSQARFASQTALTYRHETFARISSHRRGRQVAH